MSGFPPFPGGCAKGTGAKTQMATPQVASDHQGVYYDTPLGGHVVVKIGGMVDKRNKKKYNDV